MQGLSVPRSGRQLCANWVWASWFRSSTGRDAGGWPPRPPRLPPPAVGAPPQPPLAAPASDSGRPPLSAGHSSGPGSTRSGQGDCDSHSASGLRREPVLSVFPRLVNRPKPGRCKGCLAARPSPGSDVRAAGTRTPKDGQPPGNSACRGAPEVPKAPIRCRSGAPQVSLAWCPGRPREHRFLQATPDPHSCPPAPGAPRAGDAGASAVTQGNWAMDLSWLPQSSGIPHVTLWNLINT